MPPAVIQNITQEKNDCQVNLNFLLQFFYDFLIMIFIDLSGY